MAKKSLKRKIYLTLAASSLLFRNWTVRKKLYFGFAVLIMILAINVIVTSYEISRLREYDPKLSYLVYFNMVGVVSGCLFFWVITQSVLRPMKRIIHQIETQSSLESLRLHSNDEIGQLARAVNFMKKNKSSIDGSLDEKKLLLDAILSHSVESIFIFDQSGKLSGCSKGFEDIMEFDQLTSDKQVISHFFQNLDLEMAIKHLSQSDKEAPFYEQRVSWDLDQNKNKSAHCSICQVKSKDHEMYIGIIKEVQTSGRVKRLFSKVFKAHLS